MSTPVKSTENQTELRYYSLRSQVSQSPGIHEVDFIFLYPLKYIIKKTFLADVMPYF